MQGDCRGFGRSSTMTRLNIPYIRVLLSNNNRFLSDEPANLNTPLVDASATSSSMQSLDHNTSNSESLLDTASAIYVMCPSDHDI